MTMTHEEFDEWMRTVSMGVYNWDQREEKMKEPRSYVYDLRARAEPKPGGQIDRPNSHLLDEKVRWFMPTPEPCPCSDCGNDMVWVCRGQGRLLCPHCVTPQLDDAKQRGREEERAALLTAFFNWCATVDVDYNDIPKEWTEGLELEPVLREAKADGWDSCAHQVAQELRLKNPFKEMP